MARRTSEAETSSWLSRCFGTFRERCGRPGQSWESNGVRCCPGRQVGGLTCQGNPVFGDALGDMGDVFLGERMQVVPFCYGFWTRGCFYFQSERCEDVMIIQYNLI